MTSHAALGVVKAGVATLKGTGVRINCISPGQIDVGISLQNVSNVNFVRSPALMFQLVRHERNDFAVPPIEPSDRRGKLPVLAREDL